MNFLEIILMATGMAMDAFAVSIGAGASGQAQERRAKFRLSFHFGLFQFLMPILGWLAGARLQGLISSFDHWIAFGLLALVAFRMIRSGLNPHQELALHDPSRGLMLIMLSIATSIDALAVGFSLAVLGVRIWYPSMVIGAVTSGFSLLGVRLGAQLGTRFGKQMEIVGGLILLFIGFRILILHLFFQ